MTNNYYTDSHCHLDFSEFTPSLQRLLHQCQQANINNILIPAIAPKNWQAVLTLCKKHTTQALKLHPCLGIHPWFLAGLDCSHLNSLAELILQEQHNIVAIGEAGIDGKIALEQNNLSQQIEFFDYQLSLAKTYQRPIIVHHRRSHQAVMKLLRKAQLPKAGIIHAFSGSFEQAKQYIDLGFKLGIGGTITYPRAEKTIKTVKRLPLSSMVLETDAPAMPLYGQQGKVNSPLEVVNVFNCLAKLRSESSEELANALQSNFDNIVPLANSKTTAL